MIVGCYSSNKTILTPNTYKYLVKGDQALLKGNYLSEFKTNIDKNKVLKNLGIVNPKWGNIEGNIEDQKDLMDKLKTSIVDNITSEKVSYDNNDYPELSNVKKALDQLLHKDLNVSISPFLNLDIVFLFVFQLVHIQLCKAHLPFQHLKEQSFSN